MVRATFTINNTYFALPIILLFQGRADVTAVRFFLAFLLDLGEFSRKTDALLSNVKAQISNGIQTPNWEAYALRFCQGRDYLTFSHSSFLWHLDFDI
jgi:hypothetical protein